MAHQGLFNFNNLRYPISMQSEPTVLYEDKDLLLVNKPAGWLVHGVYHKGEAKHDEETLVDWIAKKYPEVKDIGDVPAQRGGIVHRLDRETSGVMVIARTQESFAYLKKLFQTRDIHKTYRALVWGRVKADHGVIDKPISIIDGSVKRTVFKGKMSREAVTEYRVIKRYATDDGRDKLTLVEVSPKTGRTHQIRVHFSSLGHSVVGDKLYGKKGSLAGLERQFLHAYKIEFISPSGKKITGVSELPAELVNVVAALVSESE
jgi:23S rRNA pseudouridine1911/1915/1917 synthase